MFVCVSAYTCEHVYKSMCACVSLNEHMYADICIHRSLCTCVYAHVYMCTLLSVQMSVCIHVHGPMCMCAYMGTCAFTYALMEVSANTAGI